MSETGPKLSVVAPSKASQTLPTGGRGSEAAGRKDRTGTNSSKLIWLFAALLLIVGVALVAEMQRGRELEYRIGELTGELATAHSSLDAYRGQLGAVRGQLGAVRATTRDLERSLAELEELAGRDPTAAP